MPATATPVPDLVPARMLNEFAYCPRLAYLMWVEREWADNVETLEGKHAHRRVDREPGERERLHDRSIQLSSPELGVTAVLDLVERDGRRARPVDYKRGKRPPVAGGVYEPERVQLCIQGLLLREAGYTANEGLIYYVASRERVRVRFTKALVERTLELWPRCAGPWRPACCRRPSKTAPSAPAAPWSRSACRRRPGSCARAAASRARSRPPIPRPTRWWSRSRAPACG